MGLIKTLAKLYNGLAANDGTGDDLRTGAGRINDNSDILAATINAMAAAIGSAVKPYQTKAAMTADAQPDGVVAFVYQDGIAANNGSYVRQAGAWMQSFDNVSNALGNAAGFMAAGANAAIRSFQDKARDVIHLRDYYQTGDAGDWLPAFNRAFAYAATLGTAVGIELQLPAMPSGSPIWVSGTIVLPNNLRIRGKGWKLSCIKLLNGKNVTVMKSGSWDANHGTGSSVDWTNDLIDFMIDGNRANNTAGYGIQYYGHSHFWSNVRVVNTAQRGIWTEFGAGGTAIGGVEACMVDITTDTTGEDGWYYDGPHDSYVFKCHCIDSWLNDATSTDTVPGTNTGAGFYTTANGAAGLRAFGIHPWKRSTTTPRPLYAIYAAAGVWTHCAAEGGHNALMLQNGARFVGGDAFGTSPGCATVTFGSGGNCVLDGANLTNNRATSCVALRFTTHKHEVRASVSNYTGAVIDNQTAADLMRCDIYLRAYACTQLLDPAATVFFDQNTSVLVRGDGSPALTVRYDSPGANTYSTGGADASTTQALDRPFARIAGAGTYRAMRLQFGQRQTIINRTAASVSVYPWYAT